MSAVEHRVVVKTLLDQSGLIFFAECSCGWKSDHHPSAPTVAEASQRATSDADSHRADVGSLLS